MISAAAGAAAGGFIPFCSTFAKFVMRAYDQVEMAIIGGANIKITGSHAGVTLAADGPSQMSLPDVAFFRSFCHVKNFNGGPAVRYFFPADAVSAYNCTVLMANVEGCCYQRTLRAAVKPLYKPGDTDFKVGGFRVVREGRALTLAAAGYMVHECLKACDEAKLDATVVDCYSLPLEADGLLKIAEKTGGRLMTVEDNYTGGLDAELAMAIARSGSGVRLQPLHVRQIPKSGRTPEDVLDYLGIDSRAIVRAVREG
jgi:transketolase